MHIAPTRPRFDGIRRIAVLRGGGLGDLLFAMPAIDALAAEYPDAEIVLLGSPGHRALLEGRPSRVDRVEELPLARGVREEPGRRPDDLAIAEFRRRVLRDGALDLGVQLHGGGRNANRSCWRSSPGTRSVPRLRMPLPSSGPCATCTTSTSSCAASRSPASRVRRP